jgi:hypothetical protein
MMEYFKRLTNTECPDSPTDFIFIIGSLSLLSLQVYATICNKTIPFFDATLIALGGYKSIKIGADWQKAKAKEKEIA